LIIFSISSYKEGRMNVILRVDNYTKFILTLIALLLLGLFLRETKIIPSLYAQDKQIMDVRIRSIERTKGERFDPLLFESTGNLRVEIREPSTLPVEVKNELLAVEVREVKVKSSLVPVEEDDLPR